MVRFVNMSSDDVENSELGARFREERARLSMSQADLSSEFEVSRHTVTNWEAGASSPPAKVLARFYELGADILYIITGVRLPPHMLKNQSSEMAEFGDQEPGGAAKQLSEEIVKLHLSYEDADALLGLAIRLAGRV